MKSRSLPKKTKSPTEEEEIPEDEAQPGKEKGGAKPTVESALNKLRKVDAKSAEVLRREHFQNVQYRSAGTPQEVQTMKDFMTLHGGEEEISSKIEQGDRFATELDMVARGDRQIVKDIAGDSPEGLMKLAPSVLEECQRIDPKRFGVMMAAPMARIFRESGVTPLMQHVSRLISNGDQKQAFAGMKDILDWVAGVEQLAEQNQEQPLTDRESATAGARPRSADQGNAHLSRRSRKSVRLAHELSDREASNSTHQRREEKRCRAHARTETGFGYWCL